MAGRPEGDAGADDVLLQVRDLGDGQLGAEVAAGDHDRPAGLDDPLQVLDRGPGLDLGHDQRAPGVGLGADPADVVGRAHERDRHHVDAPLDEGVEHAEVVGRGRGDAQAVGRDVDAGPALQVAAVADRGDERPVAVLSDDLDGDGAVAEDEPVADLDVADDALVADLDDLGGAGAVAAGSSRSRSPSSRATPPSGNAPGPHLGPGQVDEDADGPVRPRPRPCGCRS